MSSSGASASSRSKEPQAARVVPARALRGGDVTCSELQAQPARVGWPRRGSDAAVADQLISTVVASGTPPGK